MIHAVIELGERRVHEVMVPRIDIVGLEADADLATAVERIIGGGHSRLPVWERLRRRRRRHPLRQGPPALS